MQWSQNGTTEEWSLAWEKDQRRWGQEPRGSRKGQWLEGGPNTSWSNPGSILNSLQASLFILEKSRKPMEHYKDSQSSCNYSLPLFYIPKGVLFPFNPIKLDTSLNFSLWNSFLAHHKKPFLLAITLSTKTTIRYFISYREKTHQHTFKCSQIENHL